MRDMTTGPVYEHLWRYAVPILLGNWLQLAYNAIDSIIAGKFIGKDALAAEGIAGPVMNLVILAITGLCIGTGVLMTGLCIVLSPFILKLLDVPDEIFDITTVYLRIIFLGMPFTFFYNTLPAGLKSAGNSKTPLKFLAFSSVLNAGLDLLFLGGLHFGIVCSAVTTVVAEAISALLAIGYLFNKFPELFPRKEEWKTDKELLKKILKYGAPSAFQQAVQPLFPHLLHKTGEQKKRNAFDRGSAQGILVL